MIWSVLSVWLQHTHTYTLSLSHTHTHTRTHTMSMRCEVLINREFGYHSARVVHRELEEDAHAVTSKGARLEAPCKVRVKGKQNEAQGT